MRIFPLRPIFITTLILTGFSACKRDDPLLPFERISVDVNHDLSGIHRSGSDTLYVSGGNEDVGVIYRSVDNGLSWKLLPARFDKWINDIWIENGLYGFCADSDVLIYSTDNGGFHWDQFFPDQWPLSVTRNLRDIQKAENAEYYICGGKNFSNGLIYKSEDGGNNWTYTEFPHELRGMYFNTPSVGLAVGYGVILRTDDRGISWNVVPSPDEFYTGITGDDIETLWACGFNGGIYKSTDNGLTWVAVKRKNKTFSLHDRFTCIDRHETGVMVSCGIDGLVAVSKNNGINWEFYESFSGTSINNVILISKYTAIAVGDKGSIFRIQM